MGGGCACCSWRWNRNGCKFVIYTLHGNESACANFSPTISQKWGKYLLFLYFVKTLVRELISNWRSKVHVFDFGQTITVSIKGLSYQTI